jgi:hypothetical protein
LALSMKPMHRLAARTPVYNQFPGGGLNVSKSLQEWLSEGEQLYGAALSEFQQLEAQLEELESKLAAKKAELNQIAQVVGKPPVESSRRVLTAELVDAHGPNSVPNSPATIARALTGRGLGR